MREGLRGPLEPKRAAPAPRPRSGERVLVPTGTIRKKRFSSSRPWTIKGRRECVTGQQRAACSQVGCECSRTFVTIVRKRAAPIGALSAGSDARRLWNGAARTGCEGRAGSGGARRARQGPAGLGGGVPIWVHLDDEEVRQAALQVRHVEADAKDVRGTGDCGAAARTWACERDAARLCRKEKRCSSSGDSHAWRELTPSFGRSTHRYTNQPEDAEEGRHGPDRASRPDTLAWSHCQPGLLPAQRVTNRNSDIQLL